VGACCCIFIFRSNRYLLEYSAFFCFLIAPRLISAILVVQDVNAILKHTYNTAVRAQLISQRRDGCMVHPPPSFPHSAPTHVSPRCDDVTNLMVDGVKRFTPAVRHIHVKRKKILKTRCQRLYVMYASTYINYRNLLMTSKLEYSASCTMGTGSFSGVKSGRGVTLTPHPLLVPWS